ncbi:MAG: glycosyltransferase family 4 protein [Pseudomonadota bacterium]|nr:glycosyltransferase family 4 protein [Pseudomonadota bacterium]
MSQSEQADHPGAALKRYNGVDENRMRLLFLNYEFPPVGGGAGYASLATAREFVAMGHRVDFLTAATPGDEQDREIDGIRVFRVRCRRRSIHNAGIMAALSFVGFAIPRLRALARANRYDAYHYYFGVPTGLLSRMPGVHHEGRYLVSLRGSDVPGYDPRLTRYHRLLLPVTRRIWSGAYRVIANSHELRNLALSSMPNLRVDVIPNGVAIAEQVPGGPVSHGGGRILTVSRLIERKGVDTLIRALALSASAGLTLDIAGEGPHGPQLRRLASSLGVADRVRFHGFVDRAGLALLYAQADTFALISRSESCSVALLEAMAAGLPIVASNVGGNAELVRQNVNGFLVEPDDIVQLQNSLCRLVADPGLRARLGTSNRAIAQRRHAWRAVAQRYEAIFREAAQHADHADAAA